jgi:release factor glutamine methyltransferase
MILKDAIDLAAKRLSASDIPNPKTDAEILLTHFFSYNKKDLVMNWSRDLSDDQLEAYLALIDERAGRVPTQYITNKQGFFDCVFFVDKRVLIPRPETELLVEEANALIKENKLTKILDIGTGSGNIAISIAKKNPRAKILATDISEEALEVAKKNAAATAAGGIKFLRSDLFENVKKKFNMIIFNPPYIKSSDMTRLQPEVGFEPTAALDGGEDGLDFYRRIINEAPEHIKKSGFLILELGYGQAGEISKMVEESDSLSMVKIVKDFNNIERIAIIGKEQK